LDQNITGESIVKTVTRRRFFLSIALLLASGLAGVTQAAVEDLISTLTGQLGVTSEQATGGAGAIFDYAKQQLSAGDFSKMTDAVPGIDSLIAAAPKTEDSGSMLGGMASSIGSMGGDMGGTAGALGSLTQSFSQLGLSPDMAGKFIPVVLDFVKGEGGEKVMSMLKGVLM
jgi:hypothetical protein